ncbi:hypothetical protein BCL76_103608 [Streptomyces sp. CG 926]|nr:hypothetical protein BCL76_103608 [Streptomyces sp. CG 926]
MRQVPLLGAVVDHTRELHRAALRVSNMGRYEVQNLQDQLEEADRSHRRAEIREQVLLEALQSRQQRIAELEVTMRELEGAEADQQSEILRLESRNESAQDQITRLRQEIVSLQEELGRAREIAQSTQERCNALESQLESAEIAAESGNESRNAEALEIALQEAVESNSRAESLQRKLDRLTRENVPSARPGQDAAELKLSPAELTTTLLNFLTRKTEEEMRAMGRAIGLHYPLTAVADLLRELNKRHESSIGPQVCIYFADRSPQEVFDLIMDLGWDFKTMNGRYLPDSTLTWFTWGADSQRILEMIHLFAEFPSDEPIRTIFKSIAVRKNHTEITELVGSLSAEHRQLIIDGIATERPESKIPGLLFGLREADQIQFADLLIEGIAKSRIDSIDPLLEIFKSLGAAGERDLFLFEQARRAHSKG